MEDGEMPWMHKYGESKVTQIVVAVLHHVTSGVGCMKFQAAWFLLDRVHLCLWEIEKIHSGAWRP